MAKPAYKPQLGDWVMVRVIGYTPWTAQVTVMDGATIAVQPAPQDAWDRPPWTRSFVQADGAVLHPGFRDGGSGRWLSKLDYIRPATPDEIAQACLQPDVTTDD